MEIIEFLAGAFLGCSLAVGILGVLYVGVKEELKERRKENG